MLMQMIKSLHNHITHSLYVCCVGATTLDAYFPKGSKWYELYTGNVESAAGGATMTLNTPIDYIPVS